MIKSESYDEKRAKAILEVEEIINSGKYSVVDLSIFDRLDNYNVSENTINLIDYTMDLYKDFYDELMEYSLEFREKFLQGLKAADIIDNQSMEKEDSFLISLYRAIDSKNAADVLISNYGSCIDRKFFVDTHDLLLAGSSSSMLTGVRDDNLKYVGSIVSDKNGKTTRKIDYFPIRYNEIDNAIERFIDYYNSHVGVLDNSYDALVRPIIYHGIIAALQLFKDGNTRYARIFQNVEMWGLLNREMGLDLSSPLVYASRQYSAFRDDYRKYVSDIAQNKEGCFDNWINFNLKRIQDGLYYNQASLDKVSSRTHMVKFHSK